MKGISIGLVRCFESRLAPCSPGPRNTALCMLVSGLIGSTIGYGLIALDASGALLHSAMMPLLPLLSGLGASLVGMIVGGSGLIDSPAFVDGPEPPAISIALSSVAFEGPAAASRL